jgi:glyoxylase-like metal-dependent hydrolase (beta-lactamase superfamily II)
MAHAKTSRQQAGAATAVCQEIAPDVYWLEVGGGYDRSNVYFVRSPAGWVLIDTASKHCGQFIRTAAESLFGVNTRPEVILLTHDHPDHAGSVLELVQMWGSPVYVHPDEWPLVALRDLATLAKYANPLDRWVIMPLLRILPTQRVESILAGESLAHVVQDFDPHAAVPGLPDWKCVPTPGHTPGHAAFYRSSDRVVIAGDALVTVDLNSWRSALLWLLGRPTPRVSGPPWYSTWDRHVATESVIALAALEPRVLASGHGMPMAGAEVPGAVRAFAASLLSAERRGVKGGLRRLRG